MTEASKGYATMGGSFKLTFKGHSTDSMSYNADATEIQVTKKMLDHRFLQLWGEVQLCRAHLRKSQGHNTYGHGP